MLVQALGFALTILLARTLGENDFGRFSLIMAVVFVGNVATTFGMDTLLIREIAADSRTNLPSAALRVQLVLSVGFIGIVGGGAWLLNPQRVGGLIVLYSLSLIPLAFSTVYSSVLRASEHMERYLIMTVSTALLQIVGSMILLAQGAELGGIIGWLLLTQVWSAVIAGGLVRLTNASIRPLRPYSGPLWRTIRQSMWLVILMVLSVVMQRFGIFALSLLGNAGEVGVFSAALRITDVFRIVPYAVFGALLPRLMRSLEGDVPRWVSAVVVGGGTLATVMVIGSAKLLISLLYGGDYVEAVSTLQVLAINIPLYGLTGLLDLQLVAVRREKTAARAAGIGLAIGTVLVIGLYPYLGMIGVAWSVVISEGIRALVLACTL